MANCSFWRHGTGGRCSWVREPSGVVANFGLVQRMETVVESSMSFLEWVGLTFIMMGLFIGLIYAFKGVDNKKKDVENSYINDDIDY